MHIEDELRYWLTSNLSDEGGNKSRNIKAVLNYYGFGELPSPTLEELGRYLSVTGERVRQIINDSFRNLAPALSQLPISAKAFSIIQSHDCISVAEIRNQLVRDGLASDNTTLRGLLRLAGDLNTCEGYDLYESSLEELSRKELSSKEAEFERRTFLIHRDVLDKLKSNLRTARKLSGRLGLAKLAHLRSGLGDGSGTDVILQIIREAPEATIVLDEGEEWYLFEDRENPLINGCERIYTLTDQCQIRVFVETLQNSLRWRGKNHELPRAELIAAWIQQSKWFLVNNGVAKFLGKKRELARVDADVVSYLKDRQHAEYQEFHDHLRGLGRGDAAATKDIMYSPLVFIDKSGGRRNYKYILVTKAARVSEGADSGVMRHHNEDDRYHIFRNRLKELAVAGTDLVSETMTRREQSILREWLFGDTDMCECAICGEMFSVSALVTAHKKKRAICNDSERVDPYIVFPLCAFGCDYLYESGLIRIEDGAVRASDVAVTDTVDKRRARALAGRKISGRWLCGNRMYFCHNGT